MALRTVELTNWLPDTAYQGMNDIQGMAPTEWGYSGLGELYKIISAPSPLVGTPQVLLRSAYPTGGQLFMGTTGSGTDSRIYSLSAFPSGAWTDRLAAGAADADWHLLQFGDNTLAAGGTGIRLKVSTPATPAFTNVTSNISPKFICRFGDRIFAANLSWNIPSIITTATTGTETDYIFASNHNDAGTFGDQGSSPGLGSAIFILRDEYGPITGIAATESYILVCKEKALIIGRRSTTYDIDWSYIGARFGCVHPRSIVVDGEDIYLWANCGPIRIVGGNEIEQIGPGRISYSMADPASASNLRLGVTAISGSTYYPIYATQDMVSGIVTWHYSPGTETLNVASMELDGMIHYDPATGKLSRTICASSIVLGTGTTTDLDYKAVATAKMVPTGLHKLSPIGNVLFVRSNGDIWQHETAGVTPGFTTVLETDPYIQTHWFASDDGGKFRIMGVFFQFPGFSDFGEVKVHIDGIDDRGYNGVLIDGGDYTGVDPSGKIDTSGSPEFQLIRLKITFGDANVKVKNGAQTTRNVRLFEVDMHSTIQAGSKGG